MKKGLLAVALGCTMLFSSIGLAQAAFPEKPVKLVVYTKPGGAIDVFARKFSAIAAKYTDATFVVVNKSGAGGVVAIKYILSSPADGYKFAAVTRSNIGKIVSTGNKINVDDLSWLAMMVSDPECVITNRNAEINTWEQLVADAKAKDGKQIWVGPAAGGNDHIMAMKTWQAAGIKAKWIPYAGGSKSMAALLGGHGVAYVGNWINSLTTLRAISGYCSSFFITSSISLPLMPPALFACSTARIAPSRPAMPRSATRPVIPPTKPILTGFFFAQPEKMTVSVTAIKNWMIKRLISLFLVPIVPPLG